MFKTSGCITLTILASLLAFSLIAQETLATSEKNGSSKDLAIVKDCLKEEIAETLHDITVNGKEFQYKAIAGNLILRNEQHLPKASIFYTAYFKEGVKDTTDRPIVFCFNGGPGSSAVWLHIGLFGPRRVLMNEQGEGLPPYQVVNNEYSILDLADLVFIDPVSTGLSRAAPGEDAKQFHGVEEDIQSIGDFIRQFITTYERWDSPKLLAGESYGTTRAAGLAEHLHEDQHIYINGVILISSVLNFQTLYDCSKGNDLPYPLYLPTYVATAWYHQKLNEDFQKDLNKALEEAKQFALTDYTLALMQGDKIPPSDYERTVQKLAYFTGLSPDFIARSNLRVNPYRSCMELLRTKNLTIGRFDSRFTGESLETSCDFPSYDPSFEAITGAFTAAFNQYLIKDLKVKSDREYKILAPINSDWNFNKAKNQFLNMSEPLHDVMIKNKKLKVFVGSGYFDLATPFFATDYTFNHLRLTPDLQKNIAMHYYDAGHMMYIQKKSLDQMRKDLETWIRSAILP